eukprot:scaffold16521_cov101-Isochrysis_galbana.AAC.2
MPPGGGEAGILLGADALSPQVIKTTTDTPDTATRSRHGRGHPRKRPLQGGGECKEDRLK